MTLSLSSFSPTPCDFVVCCLDNAAYDHTYDAMLDKTLQKIANPDLPDELWLVEHTNVYTLGQAGKFEHILRTTDTPIIKTDRGGQITWHGTGQLVAYFLWNLQALGFGVRTLVSHAEQALEDVVNTYLPAPLVAHARKDAPGVYVFDGKHELGKIASLGFKIKQGHSYHGIALNLINDLSAFDAINPCGYAGMKMLRLLDFVDFDTNELLAYFIQNLQKRRSGQLALRQVA